MIADDRDRQRDERGLPDSLLASDSAGHRFDERSQPEGDDRRQLDVIVGVRVHLERDRQPVEQVACPQADEQRTSARRGEQSPCQAEEEHRQPEETAEEGQPSGVEVRAGDEFEHVQRPIGDVLGRVAAVAREVEQEGGDDHDGGHCPHLRRAPEFSFEGEEHDGNSRRARDEADEDFDEDREADEGGGEDGEFPRLRSRRCGCELGCEIGDGS